MEKYWKLLDIENGAYTTHETEEEVNHIIDFNTRHLDDDKVTKRITISTPFANYEFQFVSVFDEYHVHQFLYFFDTIEEEYDSLAERTCDMSIDPCIDTPIIRDLAYESQDMIHKICKEFDERTKSLMERIRELESNNESNQLETLREQISRRNNKIVELHEKLCEMEHELQELQTQRDNLVNKIAELEGKLIHYAGEIDKLKYELSNSRRTNENLRELVKQINDMTHPF